MAEIKEAKVHPGPGETAVLGLLLAAFLAGAPFAAHAVGSWVYATSAQEAQAQQAQVRQVQATLFDAAVSVTPYDAPDVDARWLVRWSLDRRRMAAWDADWLTDGPRWTSRRG